jgi:DNA excision repair protein ERCC-6
MFYRYYTLQEAVAIIEERDEEVVKIFIEPPDVALNSDEDSADEESGGLIDNLTGRQLRAEAEVVFADGHRLCCEDVENEEHNDQDVDVSEADLEKSDEEEEEPKRKRKKKGRSTKARTKQKQQQKKGKREVTKQRSVNTSASSVWTGDDLLMTQTLFPETDYSSFRGLSAVQVFESLFTEDIYQLMVDECSRYALFLNCADPSVSIEEMKMFVGILLLSGYNVLPGKRFYWESSDDVRNELVYKSMRRDRFIQIMKYLHFSDNTKPVANDKMWKLRPLITLVKRNILHSFRPSQNLDYDESMIAYYGRHGCKQFIRGKPIRFGYKVWCLNSADGYLINFEVYQGRNPAANGEYEDAFGKAAAPCMQMIDDFPPDVQQLPFRFYFDNLFTGFNLLRELKKRHYGATGTIRDNRVPKDCPIISKKDMMKHARGSFEYVMNKQDGIIIARWVDNSVVTMASTVHGMMPTSNAQRYSQAEKRTISVPRPFMFGMYNRSMGGTDRMDENVSLHRIGIRGKKWWWPIFTWIVDVAVCNAWMLSRAAGSSATQLEFRREIVQTYLHRYGSAPKGAGRPSTSQNNSLHHSRVTDELRFDGVNHLICPTTEGKRRRCAGAACTSVGRTECRKCDAGLCVSCFAAFHTK